MVDMTKAEVGDTVVTKLWGVGVITKIEKGVTYPYHVEFDPVKGCWNPLFTTDGRYYDGEVTKEKDITEIIKKGKTMRIENLDGLTELKDGQKVKAVLRESVGEVQGEIAIVNGKYYLLQNKQGGRSCGDDKRGYKYSWCLLFETSTDFIWIQAINPTIEVVEPIKVTSADQLRDGQHVTCKIGNAKTVIEDGIITIEPNGDIFICQDLKSGSPTSDTKGKKYSWVIHRKEYGGGLNLTKYEVTDLVILPAKDGILDTSALKVNYTWDGIVYTKDGVDGVSIDGIRREIEANKAKIENLKKFIIEDEKRLARHQHLMANYFKVV